MAISMTEGPLHQLELLPMGEGAWRLCDHSVDSDDPASIVAYVEQTAYGVEVVWLQGRGGSSHFDELSDVLRAAAMDLSLGAGSRATRPIEIPHFAPLAPPKADRALPGTDRLLPDRPFDVNPMGGSPGRQ
jgi:hypothetical protein